ncbi:MAG: serine--tRNA ligase [Candidatus Woesearchaeota archaeon]
MLDIKFIRENKDVVIKNLEKKFQEDKIESLEVLLEKDEIYRKILKESEILRSKRNKLSESINTAKKEGKDVAPIIQEAKEIPGKIKELEEQIAQLKQEITDLQKKIPNIIAETVPIGKDESENIVILKGPEPRNFTFDVKNHVELVETLGLVNFEASAKVSGAGFYYLIDELAILNQALIRFAIDFMRTKKYQYIETPLMLSEECLYGSMDKAEIDDSVYTLTDGGGLIGTAEQSLLAMHTGDTFQESELPKKYFSYSMCFRKEIGAHGINEKGLWRTHQFNKVEQFIFCKPEDSPKLYEELLQNSKEILEQLELPYRVIECCSGDLANWKHKSADLEVWRPTTKSYGEVMSLSNCTSYQAEALGIKWVDKHGNREFVHTLNDTALATSRIMVMILENNQQEDGSIIVPKVLQKHTGFEVIKKK